MTTENIQISKAREADLEDLLALLTLVDLTTEGVKEHLSGFFVARDKENRLLGCAGLERYGDLALLRSVAVAPDIQHQGLGAKLTACVLDDAANSGVEKVVLLTTTARDFFACRFGFTECNRADYDDQLAASPEWSLPRCSSAVLMRLPLS